MAWVGLPDREAIVDFAKRETSPEHYREFEPITRGPVFAVLMLIPLVLVAAVFLAADKIIGQVRRSRR